jgi:hypothetical protein
MDRGRGARSTMDRRWHGSKAPEHGGVLAGVWPLATPVHGSSPAGVQQQEGSTGSSARELVWRPGDSGETVEEGGDSGTHASGEGEE